MPSAQRPTTTNFYDKGGNIIATIDANNRTVQMQYDAFGRLTNTVDAIGNTISFEYDKNGNQTALIDGKGNRTQFVYDGLNRKISTIYPDQNHEDAEYDCIGNRIKRIDCNGAVTHYGYDLMSRLKTVLYGSATATPARTYTYDLAGNLLTVTESDPTDMSDVSYSYDSLNRVTNETSAGVTHQYSYDLNGNRTNAVYGVTGRSVVWAYDALNRISQITDNGSQITTYSYDLNGNPVYRQYPSGVIENRTFDAMNRLLSMTSSLVTDNQKLITTYSYDAVGSARKMVQSSTGLTNKTQDAVTHWSYDNRYRLTNETVTLLNNPTTNNLTTSYAWDNADNRLSKTVVSNGVTVSSTVYSNNALNQMLGYIENIDAVSSPRSVTFAYDANGSRTNKIEQTTNHTNHTKYVYDPDNRLIQAVVSAPSVPSVANSFAYDYRSRRIYRQTPTETNLCVFDGGLSIQEYDLSDPSEILNLSSEILRTEYIRGEGLGGGVGGMVYSIKHDLTPNTTNLTPSIICSHANHRGDVIARSDTSGSLTSFALYEAYGTRPYEWGSDPDRQKANTKEEEKDLGLIDDGMRYRTFDGVYLTRDPIGFGDGPNVYCYVHCNPITHFDAFGLWEYDEDTQELIDDGNLNLYEKGEGDFDDSSAGKLVDYNSMENMLKTAENGFVTLPDGRNVKEDSFQNAFNANTASLESSAKHPDRLAHEALAGDGHINRGEAEKIKEQVQAGGVVSLGEHWNAREVLNRVYTEDILANPAPEKLKEMGFTRMYADIYHGPGFGADVKKYVNNKTGAEIVFNAQGKLETRTNYKGTFNYGTGKNGNGYSHKDLDMKTYFQWGSGFNDSTPVLDKKFGAGATDLLRTLGGQ